MKKFLSLFLLAMISVAASAALTVKSAGGWNESAWMEFTGFSEDYSKYNAYVSADNGATWTLLDYQLVRSYGSYGRVDALGLKAGSYKLKVVPVSKDAEVEADAAVSDALTVEAYNRDGYAHHNAAAGIGAYNNDGTLKAGARVLYITKFNAKTVTMDMKVDSKGKTETRTGIQDIIQAYEKGQESTPLAVRIIGLLDLADMPALGSKEEGLQVKGKGHAMNLTIEGVGNDAAFRGFGMLVRACQYVEIRNIGVMNCMDDCISLDTDNQRIWVHNNDVFYGKAGSGDHAKGDGAIDVKGTLYCTVSANHYWDTGKSTLNSNGDEVDFVTYHHNWYDHSDSRHPRVRKSQHLHVFNNYYDGNSKYGVGATTGSCIFVEANYFRNCKFPVLISMQGSDLYAGTQTLNKANGTFSSENGGMIKTFNNYITGATTTYIPYGATEALVKGEKKSVSYMDTKTHFDAYEVAERNATVPAEVVTLQGGTGYNNFDTEAGFYTYSPDAPADVPANVTGAYGAGRCQHGDLQFTFDNATEDTNYGRIAALATKLDNYTSSFEKILGDNTFDPSDKRDPSSFVLTSAVTVSLKAEETSQITSTGAAGTVTYTSSNAAVATVDASGKITAVSGGTAVITVADPGSETVKGASYEVTVTVVKDLTGSEVCHFTGNNPSTSMVNLVAGNYSNSKGTVTYGDKTYNICVKMESSTELAITPTAACKVTLVFGGTTSAANTKIKLDGSEKVLDAKGEYTFDATAGTKYTLTKGTSINLFLIIFDANSTGVEEATAESKKATKAVKVAKNGRLVIVDGDKEYSVSSARMK